MIPRLVITQSGLHEVARAIEGRYEGGGVLLIMNGRSHHFSPREIREAAYLRYQGLKFYPQRRELTTIFWRTINRGVHKTIVPNSASMRPMIHVIPQAPRRPNLPLLQQGA